jgi:hypothetical protein
VGDPICHGCHFTPLQGYFAAGDTDVGIRPDTAILQAYQEQHTTVEPGCRWIKHPAAISPVWLEKPERMAALAMLTTVGLLVYSLIQRQVRLDLLPQSQQLPGNNGPTIKCAPSSWAMPAQGGCGIMLFDTSL